MSIHASHDDAYAVRDSGWVQLFAENPQEAYDLSICAFPIAEDPEVRTPTMICMDCFLTTHSTVAVTLETDKDILKFIGPNKPIRPLLNLDNPASYGEFAKPDTYQEFKYTQQLGHHNALEKSKEILAKFDKKFGRLSGGLVETKGKGKVAIICLGSIAGTINKLIDSEDITLIRPRLYRPFPATELKKQLEKFDRIIVLDRSSQCGAQYAPLCTEIKALGLKGEIKNVVFGLGSRETNTRDIKQLIDNYDTLPNDTPYWLNLRSK